MIPFILFFKVKGSFELVRHISINDLELFLLYSRYQ